MNPVKQWVTAVLAGSLLGCQAEPPEPLPKPDHLLEDVKRIGEELRACQQAEIDRKRGEVAMLNAQIASTKKENAAYCRLLGDAGCARAERTPVQP